MTEKAKVKIPKHLKPETKRWFREITERFELESQHERLLLLACECWDRRQQAREILDRDGLICSDKYGAVKPHPCVQIEKDAGSQFMRAVRELGLDLADDAPRPTTTQPRHHRS